MSKFRKNKIKIEHHTLEDFDKYIKELVELECVESIIPGRIFRNNKGRGSKGLFLQYETNTGYKLLFKNGTSVQEVFIICNDKKVFLESFNKIFGKKDR